jgi:hypothetical protein
MIATYSWRGTPRRSPARLAQLAALASLLLAALPATVLASGSDAKPLPSGIAATPARIELGVSRRSSEIAVDVAITNRGAQPTRVHTELSDLVVTQGGAYETVPAGETPYSVSSVAQIDRSELNLDENGVPGATAIVHIWGTADNLDRPLYGALSVELEEPAASIMDVGGVRVAPELRPSILIPVLIVPIAGADATADSNALADSEGHVGSLRLGDSIRLQLQDLSLSVGQRDQNGWLDHVIPVALPGVADHGPLLATADVQNTGNAFGRAFTKYAFTGVNPLGYLPESVRAAVRLDERPFLEVEAPPAALMPDMQGRTRALTAYAPTPGTELDATPWFGLVRVRATTTLVLADFESAPVVREIYVLVVPWKEALVILAGAALCRVWRTRRRKPGSKLLHVSMASESAEAA